MATQGMALTLKKMREEKGLTAEQVASEIARLLKRDSYHFSSVLKAEKDGTRQYDVIRAYAIIYGHPVELVAETTRPENNYELIS